MAIDSGNSLMLPADETDLDGDGDVTEPIPFDAEGVIRVQGNSVDLGAFESPYAKEYSGPILYVDNSRDDSDDASGWSNVYGNLQTALSHAAILNADSVAENNVSAIWIAEGTYYPAPTLGTEGSRAASFKLVDGVSLYGGFAGTETTLDERDLSSHETILSGDIGVLGDSSDNVFSVIYCGSNQQQYPVIEAVLENLTIVEGNASSTTPPDSWKGYCGGGGIYVASGNTLTIRGCTISNNYGLHGGGIQNDGGTLEIKDSTFTHNKSSSGGAGLYNESGTATVINTTLSNNVTAGTGGGIRNTATLVVTNSTIADNWAYDGGGLSNGRYNSSDNSSATTLNNTIVARNTANDKNNSPDLQNYLGTIAGSYNLIGDGANQTELLNGVNGNQVGTSAEPIDPRISPLTQLANARWGHRLFSDSPAINAGNNAFALDATGNPLAEDAAGNPRVLDGTVDIGATEGYIPNCSPSSSAQTYIVESLEETIAEDGILTFIEAFEAANGNYPVGDAPAGSDLEQDVIQFTEGLGGTISLTSGELKILDDLCIEGPGAELLTFDAAEQSRVLSVYPDVSVYLSGITITGGKTDYRYFGKNGGGIYSDSGNLVVKDCIISDCYANDCGGGIYSTGTLTIENSTVVSNTSSSGGGIYDTGKLTINGSTIAENRAGYRGAGVYHCGNTFTVTGSIFSGNAVGRDYSGGGGGGVIVIGGTTTQANLTESEAPVLAMQKSASVPWGEGDGGGIWNSAVSTIVNCTFLANTARGYSAGIHNKGSMTITNSEFFENFSAQNGGAIGNYEGTLLKVINSIFVANNADYSGSAIYNYETQTTVTNSTFVGNTSSSSVLYTNNIFQLYNSILWKNIGGELDEEGNYTVIHSLVGLNPGFVRMPTDGGDGWGDDPSTVDIDESANDDYGDLQLTAQSIAVNYGGNNLLPWDTADLDNDGNKTEALPLDLGGSPRVYGDTVDCGVFEFQGEMDPNRETPSLVVTTVADTFDLFDNQTSLREAIFYLDTNTLDGDAITFQSSLDNETITLDEQCFQLNRSVVIDASAVHSLTIDAAEKSSIFLISVPNSSHSIELKNITLTKADGSAIRNHYATLTLTNCTFTDNVGSIYGGGIYNEQATLTVANCNFFNGSGYKGVGIYDIDGVVTVENSIFRENSAFGYGAGVYADNTALTIKNCTFENNSAQYKGGSIYVVQSDLTLEDSSLLGNSAEKQGGGIYISYTTATLSNCVCQWALQNRPVRGALKPDSGFVVGWWFYRIFRRFDAGFLAVFGSLGDREPGGAWTVLGIVGGKGV